MMVHWALQSNNVLYILMVSQGMLSASFISDRFWGAIFFGAKISICYKEREMFFSGLGCFVKHKRLSCDLPGPDSEDLLCFRE